MFINVIIVRMILYEWYSSLFLEILSLIKFRHCNRLYNDLWLLTLMTINSVRRSSFLLNLVSSSNDWKSGHQETIFGTVLLVLCITTRYTVFIRLLYFFILLFSSFILQHFLAATIICYQILFFRGRLCNCSQLCQFLSKLPM